MVPSQLPFLRFVFLTFFSLAFFIAAPVMAGSDVDQNWVEVRSTHFTVATNAGEKEARRVGDQFEEIRLMFQNGLPGLRVDPAQPIVIVVAKNESTMKVFLPEAWAIKGHVHPAGIYQEGEDKHYVLMEADAQGENPFHTLYHEYTHALLHLNFKDLPLWLDEGLAEFFGNSTLGDKESKTGTIDEGHLYILSQNKLLPVETLLEVDHNSPHYNEANRASVFYAESWALVHYLMLDPDARQKQLLTKFLNAWSKSGNQVQAAREAFGDLKQFNRVLEDYARQSRFHYGLIKAPQSLGDTNHEVRKLSLAEALTLRGDFFAHNNQPDQAKPVLDQAVQLEPTLAAVHEALGYLQYRQQNLEAADKEMEKAIELGTTSFVAPYYRGMFLLQRNLTLESGQEAVSDLQKATQINPQFAPAYEGLAQAFALRPATQKQAIDADIKAVQLDPYRPSYLSNLAHLLLNNDRFADARVLAQKLHASAKSPEEMQMANDFQAEVEQREQWRARTQTSASSTSLVAGDAPASTASAGSSKVSSSTSTKATIKPPTSMAVDGTISANDCSRAPEFLLTLKLSTTSMTFHIADFGLITVTAPDGTPAPTLQTCKHWAGRHVKVWSQLVQGQDYLGEIAGRVARLRGNFERSTRSQS